MSDVQLLDRRQGIVMHFLSGIEQGPFFISQRQQLLAIDLDRFTLMAMGKLGIDLGQRQRKCIGINGEIIIMTGILPVHGLIKRLRSGESRSNRNVLMTASDWTVIRQSIVLTLHGRFGIGVHRQRRQHITVEQFGRHVACPAVEIPATQCAGCFGIVE